jgi:hypothetical protein
LAVYYSYCQFIVLYLCILIPKIIATEKLQIDNLKAHFKEHNVFESHEIFKFYANQEPLVKAGTVNWRVHSLVQTGILNRIGRGRFTLGEGKMFIPESSSRIKTLNRKLRHQYPYLDICIWNTSVINEFMLHQPGRFFIVVEVEKTAAESVFYFLKEHKYQPFLDPNNDILNKYAIDQKDTIIVKSLVSESPCQIINGINTVTIEKMLVDIYCDNNIFAAQQGSEMNHIFSEALGKYSVNENRMLRYADRRGKKESFNNYLSKVSKYRQ